MEPKKKDNVVKLSHNNDKSISQEQYAKLLKGYHFTCRYFCQKSRRSVRFIDEAFTKYPNSKSNHKKLKDFEVHESRAHGKEIANEIEVFVWEKICKLEKLAREHGVDLDFQTKENEEKK